MHPRIALFGLCIALLASPHVLAEPPSEKYKAVASNLTIFPTVNIDRPPSQPFVVWKGELVLLQLAYPGPLTPTAVAAIHSDDGLEFLTAVRTTEPVALLGDRPQFYGAIGNQMFLQIFLRPTDVGRANKNLTLRFKYPDDSTNDLRLTFEVRNIPSPR